MRLTRVYRFSASHRLHSDQLTEAENRDLYGKCNNPWGHGHNYLIHISVRGVPDGGTGRILSPGALDRWVQDRLISVYDHRDLNTDVPDFPGVPTTEILALDAERRLRAGWPFPEAELDRIRVQETPRNTFELRIR